MKYWLLTIQREGTPNLDYSEVTDKTPARWLIDYMGYQEEQQEKKNAFAPRDVVIINAIEISEEEYEALKDLL
jgi:hypothetical protein